jgi:hypothetical protein
VEPILLFVEAWWWIAPAAAGAGAAAYGGLTAKSRRARRLELDAARHEVVRAHRALVDARAEVRTAQADVLAARAHSGFVGAATFEAKRALQSAKGAERAALLALRASRSRVKASLAHYHAASVKDPLPIERLYAQHDAVNARWLAYETDVAKALAYPQLSDPRHPATLAFFEAQREAQRLRPSSPRDRITPEQFVEYRAAVRALEAAFDEAERRAGARAALPRPGVWPVPTWRPLRSSDDDR